MKAVGIIGEYNPFHNGHLYHIRKVKELCPNDVVVLILSGPFTQRGDINLLNKWDKTSLALHFGVDIVVELPFAFATQSADIFAYGSISLLNHLQVKTCIFGSESNDMIRLAQLAHVQNDPAYQQMVKTCLKKGYNYPTALSVALKHHLGITITTPNDILGISYIKQIEALKADIAPMTIQRTNHYHDTQCLSSMTSATSIREKLKKGQAIADYVPKEVIPMLKETYDIEQFFSFFQYKIFSEWERLSIYQSVDDNLIPKIKKQIGKSNSFDTFILAIKDKHYTYSRLKRMCIHILCGFTKEEAQKYREITYIRLLGFSEKGRTYLNAIKKEIEIPIITSYTNDKWHFLELENRINKIATYVLPEKDRIKQMEMEYKHPIYDPKETKED